MLKCGGLHVFTFSIAAMLLASLFLLVIFVAALNSSQVWISTVGSIVSEAPIAGLAPASYYVVASNSLYYAINGSNQEYFLVDGNAAYVINKVFGYMRSGQSVTFSGTFQIDNTLYPVSNTYLNCSRAVFNAAVTKADMFHIYYLQNVTIDGATANGNRLVSNFVNGYTVNTITVKNCNVTRFAAAGGGAAILLAVCYNDTISNNTLIDNTGEYGIVSNGPVNNDTFTGNYIDAWGNGSCIGLFGSNPSSSNTGNVISYNTCHNWSQVTWHGVYVGGCIGAKVYGNYLSDDQCNGGVAFLIKSENTLIYNNTVYQGGANNDHAFGIFEEGTGSSPNGTVIWNNTLIGNSVSYIDCFWLTPYYDYTPIESIGNITIANNTIANWGTALYIQGYNATDTYDNVIFSGNNVSNCSVGFSVGYLLTQNSYTSNNIISNNTFTNIDGRASPPGVLGYVAANVLGTQIIGNTASGTVTTPILIDEGIGTHISGNIPNNWGAP
jgi:hypothetical protein